VNTTTYFLFSELPGYWPKYTLAVLAVNLKDARNYIKAWHHGGTFISQVKNGTVNADCGAVTAAAQEILAQKIERGE
jgi:hypothetical protein